jgi:transposase-like protein
MKFSRRKYSESFRRKVVNEYLTTDISQKELQLKYDIKSPNYLSRWRERYEGESLVVNSSKSGNLEDMKPKDLKKLTERIKELEKALEEAEFRAIGYKKLVENVEKELGIHLPKKSSTKQSKS